MWTSKRMLLMLAGVGVFLTGFAVYARVLGHIDGLPPLPADCAPQPPGSTPAPPIMLVENQADRQIRQAFGEECPELRRAIKLWVRDRGLALAADQFSIEADGRVKLAPFSVALFGKANVDEQGKPVLPEINTVRSDVAYLTFDRPITNHSEIAERKIIAGELDKVRDKAPENLTDGQRHGNVNGVYIVNSRGTPNRDDDLSLFTRGPVYFQDEKNQIWTREPVELIDQQSKPKPTIIKATGMDVYLFAEEPASKTNPPRKAAAKPAAGKTPTVNGVKRVVLRADVNMFLMVDADSGFLGGSKKDSKAKVEVNTAAVSRDPSKADQGPVQAVPDDKAPAKTGKPAPPEKAQVVITTQGPFDYDLLTDIAHFDISQHPGPYPTNQVLVTRQHQPGGPMDQLVCDHLELKFARKAAKEPAKAPAKPAAANKQAPAHPPAAAPESNSNPMQIETAHATGNQVILTSDTEALEASGNDLTYDAKNKRSILKGDPKMIAIKDGNVIYAKVLILENMGAKDSKDNQKATAQGPGRIELRDKSNPQSATQRTQHASWKDVLVYSKDGAYDLLVLKGDAVFEDKDQNQMLQADTIKVWLEPAEKKPATKAEAASASGAPPAATESQKVRPHHLDALGHVQTRSPELNVYDTEHLIVWFKDAPVTQVQLPAKLPEAPTPAIAPPGSDGQHVSGKPANEPTPAVVPQPATPESAAPGATAAPAKPAKPKKPIDLSARSVEAFVIRQSTKNELDRLWCEGSVKVHQDPATADEKGVDITGQTLQLTNFPEGRVLVVTGDLAEVHLDKLSIIGPEVNIDQKENHAWVNGIGAMRMPSSTDFNGTKLDQASELTVHWNRNMFFNGKDAQFYGGVQAEQDSAHLACQTMQVFLDRFVSIREGDRGKTPAKVEKMVCDKSVRVEDTKREGGRPDGKLLQYQRIDSIELFVDNQDGRVVAPGPGVVRILQPGTKGEAVPGPQGPAKPAPTAPKEEELKLTRITYLGRMFANNQTHTAIFYTNVEVVNVPTDNPDLAIDIDHLPEGGMYLRCEVLKVYTEQDKAGKTVNQQMEAHQKALVQAREFWGRADIIKYDQNKDMVILEAREGNLATLYRVLRQGAPPEEIKGKKIIYSRKTNTFSVEGATKAQGSG